MHWEKQKWGRAWFEMGLGGGGVVGSMADSPHIELGIGLGSSQCLSFRAKFRPVQRIFQRIKKRPKFPKF